MTLESGNLDIYELRSDCFRFLRYFWMIDSVFLPAAQQSCNWLGREAYTVGLMVFKMDVTNNCKAFHFDHSLAIHQEY